MENNENLEKKVENIPTSTTDNKPKKKKNSALIIILILVLLCGAGVGCYIVFFGKEKPKPVTIKSDNKEVKSEYRMSGNSLENFDLAFLKLENEAKNKVYSPLSIKYALAMLSDGSKGDTKEQIDAVIGEYKSKKYTNSEHLSLANSMFIKESFKEAVQDDYKTKLQEKYNAEVILDSFESAKNVNDWVSNKTFGLIKDIVDDDTIRTEDFELINALAIDMNWKNRIQAASAPLPEGMSQKNYSVHYIHEKYSDYIEEIVMDDWYPEMNFNNIEKTKSVIVGASFNRYDIVKDKGEDTIRNTVTEDYKKYLNDNPNQVYDCPSVEEYVNQYIKDIDTNYKKEDTSTDFYIADNENEKVFAKDLQTYDNTTLQYISIMPKETNLDEYIKELDAEKANKIVSEMKEVKLDNFKEGVITQIKGNIPLFKFDYELKLIDDLKSLGIKDVFEAGKADLTNMVKGKGEFINSAAHKAIIEFSNDGIKAAAATRGGGMGAAHACNYDYEFEVPVEKIDITFDKPYMFIIRDKDSGEVWFTGTVYEPIKK